MYYTTPCALHSIYFPNSPMPTCHNLTPQHPHAPSCPGTATAAYQVEGAWNEDGKAPSIWDTFAQTPGKIWNNENANVAVDFYHKFLEVGSDP